MFSLPSMFHVPFKLRAQTNFCIPKGAEFDRVKPITFGLNGSLLTVYAPKHRSTTAYGKKEPKGNYDLNPNYIDIFKSFGTEWRIFTPLFRVWDFYGPWFTGVKGNLKMSVSVISCVNSNPQKSLFHPRYFETFLSEILTAFYKEDRMEVSGRQRRIGPLNWTPIKTFPSVAAAFDVAGGAQDRGNFDRCLVFPVSVDFMCRITCEIQRPLAFVKSSTVSEDNVDDWIRDQPMIDLADQIFGSVKLTLSPEAEAQQAKALEGLDNPHLSETFAPLNWGPEGGSEINDRLLAEFIQQHGTKKR